MWDRQSVRDFRLLAGGRHHLDDTLPIQGLSEFAADYWREGPIRARIDASAVPATACL